MEPLRWAVAALLLVQGCYLSTSAPGAPDDPAPEDPPPRDRPPSDPPPGVPDLAEVASPPAVAGGTLIVTRSDRAVLADPDHAAIVVTDLSTLESVYIALNDGDEPGRLVEDVAGRVHVVLRGGGAVLDLDPNTGSVLGRRSVCSAPRGIDWEPGVDRLHVACAGGELVTLRAGGGAPTRTILLDDDLRDVVAADGLLYVSRFRSAELLTVGRDGAIIRRQRPNGIEAESRMAGRVTFAPNLAWRIRALPEGGVAMLHQQSMTSPIDVEGEGYAGLPECPSGVAAPAMSVFDGAEVRGHNLIAAPTMLVDFVVGGDGRLHMVRAGDAWDRTLPPSAPPRMIFVDVESSRLSMRASQVDDPCVFPDAPPSLDGRTAVGIALAADGRTVTHLRNEGVLQVGNLDVEVLPPPAPRRGHALFHQLTAVGMACASCHPEGAEDGHTWDFTPVGPRRTQSLLGGLSGHEPFHWNGDQADMTDIMEVTFGQRMLGAFSESDVGEIERWLDEQPTVPGVVRDAAAVARGRAIFARSDVGCTGCHSGDALTNDRNEDVGTGRDFQVPSLRGVMHRAPFFHDGCAPSLDDVVDGACGTLDRHGRTSSLGPAERADLVAFLRSL